MINQDQLQTIKNITEEFFTKATVGVLNIETSLSFEKDSEVVNLEIKLTEPQILIGQGGQTLFEIQRLLRMILNKKIQQSFYLNLDINDYKKKKIEFLENLAYSASEEVVLNKVEKSLPPMSPYERRIIHAQLSQRKDITTESQGEGIDRHIIIKPL